MNLKLIESALRRIHFRAKIKKNPKGLLRVLVVIVTVVAIIFSNYNIRLRK